MVVDFVEALMVGFVLDLLWQEKWKNISVQRFA